MMVSLLQVVKQKPSLSDAAFSFVPKEHDWKQIDFVEKEDVPASENLVRDEPVVPASESNYFSFFDDASLYFFDDEESTDESHYETFTDNLETSIVHVTYLLEQSVCINNSFVDTKRFDYDIMFFLDTRKNIFEYSALGLVGGIVSSMIFLPDHFDLGMSFLLSAPLFVCILGIFAKHFKQKS